MGGGARLVPTASPSAPVQLPESHCAELKTTGVDSLPSLPTLLYLPPWSWQGKLLPRLSRVPGPKGLGAALQPRPKEKSRELLSVRRGTSTLGLGPQQQGDTSPRIPHKAGVMSEGIIHALDPHKRGVNLESRIHQGENRQSG